REKLAAHGIACEIPDAAGRARVNAVIFDERLYGRIEDASRRSFRELIESLGARGCAARLRGRLAAARARLHTRPGARCASGGAGRLSGRKFLQVCSRVAL